MTSDEIKASIDPKWHPYWDNNHVRIAMPQHGCGGHVSFKDHLGKPLSNHLWEDLMHRLQIRGLCIYTENMAQWCLGWGEGHAIIHLDMTGNVTDINFSPYWRPDFRDAMWKNGPPMYYEELGAAIGNMAALAKVKFE